MVSTCSVNIPYIECLDLDLLLDYQPNVVGVYTHYFWIPY